MRTKAIRNTGRRLRVLLLLPVVCVPAITGCTDDAGEYTDPADSASSPYGVTITITIPDAQVPATRSIADNRGEARVNTVNVLVFKKSTSSGAPATLLEQVQGSIIDQQQVAGKYQVRFRAILTPNNAATSLAILANVQNVAEKIGTATTKNKILEALVNISNNSGGTMEGWKWNAKGPSDYTPIPMYGEANLPPTGVTAGMNITGIKLNRMLARIDVVNGVSDFEPSEIYVLNYNTAGYIAPAWNTTTGELLGSLPEAPMIPTDKNTPQISFAKAMKYVYTPGGMAGEIYTYEANATTGGTGTGHTQAACLVIRGKYKGTDGYYRVDFTAGKDSQGRGPADAGFDPATVKYMPLYRNHLYQVNISAITGAGYENGETATKSLGITNNLKTEMLVVDENLITNVVFDGQYYLGTGEDVWLEKDINSTKDVLCVSNYVDSWLIDTSQYARGIQYIGTPTGWLEVSKVPIAGNSRAAYLRVKAIQRNDGSAAREAIVYLKAGLLRITLKVKQRN